MYIFKNIIGVRNSNYYFSIRRKDLSLVISNLKLFIVSSLRFLVGIFTFYKIKLKKEHVVSFTSIFSLLEVTTQATSG